MNLLAPEALDWTRLRSSIHLTVILLAFGLMSCSGCGSENNSSPKTQRQNVILSGHTGEINAVAYSPDGKSIAAVGNNGLFIWSSESSQLVHSVSQASGIRIMFSPDGESIAIGSSLKFMQQSSGTLHLWETMNWQKIREIPVSSGVNSIAFSPDGKLLAGGLDDGTIRWWDALTGQEKNKIEHKKSGPVLFVAFSHDGTNLASGSMGTKLITKPSESNSEWVSLHHFGELSLWDPQTGDKKRTITGDEFPGSKIAFAPNSNIAASAGGDDSIRLWDTQTWTIIRTIDAHKRGVIAVAFSKDGQTLASAGEEDKLVKLWDPQLGSLKSEISGHEGAVRSLSFSPTGRSIVSSDDKTVRVWHF